MKIGEVVVYVKDMEEAVRFYRDQLGLTVQYQSEVWTSFEAGRATLGVHLAEEPLPPPLVVFFTGDIERTAEELKGHGVALGAIQEQPWAKLASFKDPSGNPLMVEQPRNYVDPKDDVPN